MARGAKRGGRARGGGLAAATQRLTAAHRELRAARREIARVSIPGDPAVLVGASHRWADRLLAAHRARILRHPGVVGCGLGMRFDEDAGAETPVLTVYVRSRRARARLPEQIGSGARALPLEIVLFGSDLELHVAVGASIGDQESDPTKGTLGSFAIDAAGRTVAITAMHVSGVDELAAGDPAIALTCPSRRDSGGASVFARVTQGTRTDVDACRAELAPDVSATWDAPQIGPIKGWRPLHYPADVNLRVRLYGATSGYLEGHVRNPSIDLPDYDLKQAVVASMPTDHGDSGAALIDDQNYVVGFLVGRGNDMPANLRIFSAVSLVLDRLGVDIPHRGNP